MLKIIIGTERVEEVLGHSVKLHTVPEIEFNSLVRPEWFADAFVKEIVGTIDNADVLGLGVLQDKVSKQMFDPTKLSAGAKYLILAYKYRDILFKATMGDNCCDLLEKIVAMSEKEGKDLLIATNTLHFFNFRYINEIQYLNWNITCKSTQDIRDLVIIPYMDQELDYDPDSDFTEEELEQEIIDLAHYLDEHIFSKEARESLDPLDD